MIIIVAVFLGLLFLYSLLSKALERTPVTAPMLFTVGGMALIFLFQHLGAMQLKRESFLHLAEIGLVMILFTDATHIRFSSFISKGQLPIRLLSIGMILTICLGTSLATIVFPHLTLWEAGILAAVLAPTDAGLGQVIVRSPLVPARIRQALDIEAGLNDGLAVPFLLFFMAVAQSSQEATSGLFLGHVVEQLGYGALLGACLGLAGGLLLGLAKRKGLMALAYQQMGLVTLPLFGILACKAFGGSTFIAAYVAGLSVQFGFADASHHSAEFTEGWGQFFSSFIFFYFGMRAAMVLGFIGWSQILYSILSLTVIRMVPVAIALVGSRLNAATVLFLGWFGPRGLASIVLGLVFLAEEVQLPGEQTITLAVIATVLLSIFLHGLSALPVIKYYAKKMAKLDLASPEHQST